MSTARRWGGRLRGAMPRNRRDPRDARARRTARSWTGSAPDRCAPATARSWPASSLRLPCRAGNPLRPPRRRRTLRWSLD